MIIWWELHEIGKTKIINDLSKAVLLLWFIVIIWRLFWLSLFFVRFDGRPLGKTCHHGLYYIWAAEWQNQQIDMFAQRRPRSAWASAQSDRVFAIRVKKSWVLSYPLSAQWRLWSDWADAQADLRRKHMPNCWCCRVAAHLMLPLVFLFLWHEVEFDCIGSWSLHFHLRDLWQFLQVIFLHYRHT